METLNKSISKIKRIQSLVNECKVNKDGDFYTQKRLETIELNLVHLLNNLSELNQKFDKL